jgi:sirohydrochlorin ferrochelatase
MPICFLIDNGSLRASSTLNLRLIAAALERESGRPVAPVSLLHSSAVDPGELGGEPAEILEPALRRRLEKGETDFLLLPLFFGPSRALTDYLPKRLAALRNKHANLKVRVAPCLFDPLGGADLRLAAILKERVEELLEPGEKPAVVMVDHGSPAPEVSYVRNFLAGQLSGLLEGRISRLVAASMERRPGAEYRFSDPLLENVLKREGFNQGNVIVSMLFLSPGRHAGAGGDIQEICRRAEEENPGLRVRITGLVGDHPALIAILADRLERGLEGTEGQGLP